MRRNRGFSGRGTALFGIWGMLVLAGCVSASTDATQTAQTTFATAARESSASSTVTELIDCAWWDPSLAPPIGARVAVSGKRMNNGLLSVQTSQIKPASGSPLSFEQRLLGFYRDCIEAETAQDRDLTPTSAAVHLVASEASMLLTGQHTFDGDPTTRKWTDARRQAGDAESVYVGFPIISTDSKGDPRIAPHLMAEVKITATGGVRCLRFRLPPDL